MILQILAACCPFSIVSGSGGFLRNDLTKCVSSNITIIVTCFIIPIEVCLYQRLQKLWLYSANEVLCQSTTQLYFSITKRSKWEFLPDVCPMH